MLQQYEKVIISTVDCFKMYVHFSFFPFSSFAIRCHERTIDHCTVAFHFCDSVCSLLMKTKMFSLLIYICIVVWGAIDQFNNATYAQCLDLDFERIISWSCLFRSFEWMCVRLLLCLCVRACRVCVYVVLHVFITFTSTPTLSITPCCSRFNSFHISPVGEIETITSHSELFGYWSGISKLLQQ